MIPMLLTRLALAQDVLLEDFDPPALTWTFVNTATGSGLIDDVMFYGTPWDGDAAMCMAYPGGMNYGDCGATSSPAVVTHGTLAFQLGSWQDNSGRLTAYRTGNGTFVASAGETVYPGWGTSLLDTSGACGREVTFTLRGFSGSSNAEYWLDDLIWTGAVCPQFLDQDADGLCPQGTDLDADGACVGPGEVAGAEVVVDCDDAAPGTDCLSLVAEEPVRGSAMRVRVTGAAPYESVGLVLGQTPGASCPAALGGRCFELSPAGASWRTVRADATGAVDVSIPVPATLVWRSEVRVQAAVVRGAGGADSRLSNLWVDIAQ